MTTQDYIDDQMPTPRATKLEEALLLREMARLSANLEKGAAIIRAALMAYSTETLHQHPTINVTKEDVRQYNEWFSSAPIESSHY